MRLARALLAAITLVVPLDSFAQQASTAPRMSREEAVAHVSEYLDSNPVVLPFSSNAARSMQASGCRSGYRIQGYSIDEAGLTLRCRNGGTIVIAFQEAPIASNADPLVTSVNVGTLAGPEYQFLRMRDEQQFIAAWAGLQRPLAPRDPLTDIVFQEALHRVSSDPVDRNEENRRTQIQVEALIAANHLDAALAAYRGALDVSPTWAAGHYNAALVAGQVENYSLAITEMRRYLYLSPGATDARAAQDQIYRWEVLLTQQQ